MHEINLFLPAFTFHLKRLHIYFRMTKRKLRFKVRIPQYVNPRNEWRLRIYKEAVVAAYKHEIEYREDDKLELDIILFLAGRALFIHDIDNRLKDIMDAFQGRVGGPKKLKMLKPIIHNDNQIYKVNIEKMDPPKQSHGLGHLIIKKYIPSF